MIAVMYIGPSPAPTNDRRHPDFRTLRAGRVLAGRAAAAWPYDVRGCLGEGGFGRVYEAGDRKLCRNVAIEWIKHAAADSASADLMREARLGASLRHAAFVKVHAIEDDGGTQSIVMELVPGQTLKQTLAAAVARAAALEWTRQIAEAMRDAHACGLVHGAPTVLNLYLMVAANFTARSYPHINYQFKPVEILHVDRNY